MNMSSWNPLRRPTASPRLKADRRTQPRSPRDTWTPLMREDYRKREFLGGVDVQDSDWSSWQDTMADFLRR